VPDERRRQGIDDGFDDFVLDREDVGQLAIVTLGPYVITVRHAAQLRGDPDAAAGATHAALENGIDVQVVSDLLNVDVAAAKPERRCPRCDSEPAQANERVDQFLG
jgi:hypothetical protein